MLSVENVSVSYDGAIVALESVSMQVLKGSIVALLGPNGAGKTTLLKAIAGMLPFERGDIVAGDILFENASIIASHPATISRNGIALVQDGRQCFRELTIGENLRAASLASTGDARYQLELVVNYFPFLKEMLNRQAGVLSGGQLQMLVIAMAVMTKPRLLLLDEPGLGLSPIMVRNVFDVVEKLHQDMELTVLVAEQTVPRLLKIATDAFVLARGRVALHVIPSALTEERLQQLYLT
jgi:branched-chain amino acid transport system ATP-binding protein